MIRAIRADRTPNLLVMSYTHGYAVDNLLLIPAFFFSEAAVQKRKPLGPTARRAGWIGCNILLSAIAPEGKLRIVQNGDCLSFGLIRSQYQSLSRFAQLPPRVRGWTLDVLRIVRSLQVPSFTLDQMYAKEESLKSLHPQNKNIRPKIRQQMQVLRDLGLIQFDGRGAYTVLR